jgi:hypothetical protein
MRSNCSVIFRTRLRRQAGPQRDERQRKQYAELLSVTRKILNQAHGVIEEVEHLPPRRLVKATAITRFFTVCIRSRIFFPNPPLLASIFFIVRVKTRAPSPSKLLSVG